jgi:predicted PurR-regulated permease PerM
MYLLKISSAIFLCFLSFVLVTPIFAKETQKLPDVLYFINNTLDKTIVLATVNVTDVKKNYEESLTLLEKSTFNKEKTK